MQNSFVRRILVLAFAVSIAGALSVDAGAASTYQILYTFSNSGATDGGNPLAGLVQDHRGVFYGTTYSAGAHTLGTVFKLAPAAGGGFIESVIYNFSGGNDGANPLVLIMDSHGNLFGTTNSGGGPRNLGAIFELQPVLGGFTEHIIHAFAGVDGRVPTDLTLDGAGNLYGCAGRGGLHNAGLVFRLSKRSDGRWIETSLYDFTGGADGAGPVGLTRDVQGNLYGTTSTGGSRNLGTAYRLSPSSSGKWAQTVLHSFASGHDGIMPAARVVFYNSQTLVGTTTRGGRFGAGSVFMLRRTGSDTWSESVIYSFGGGQDGADPVASLVADSYGALYSTTVSGGRGGGTVFKLTPAGAGPWRESVLYSFLGPLFGDGTSPEDAPILDRGGNLYGTATGVGDGNSGVIFKISP